MMLQVMLGLALFVCSFALLALCAASIIGEATVPQARVLCVAACSICALPVAAVVARGAMLAAFPAEVVLACVAVCAATDLEHGYVFDRVTFLALGVVALLSLLNGVAGMAVSGALTGAGSLGLLWRVTRGRGIGLGDVKLAAVAGSVLGPIATLSALGIAFVCGAAIAICAIVLRCASLRTHIPFAPFIAAGTAAMLSVRALAI